MHDRPTVDELLRAVETLFDEQLVPSLTGSHQYNSRVAANVIRTVRRELRSEGRALQSEWTGLNEVLGEVAAPATIGELRSRIADRTADLSEQIRAGEADSGLRREAVLAHVTSVVRAKLEASNPKWLEADTG